jgi:hypothetical protein
MRDSFAALALVLAACGSGGQGSPASPDARPVVADASLADAFMPDASVPDASVPDASPSLSDYGVIDVSGLTSSAGTWIWTTASVPGGIGWGVAAFWGVARLGASGREGVVLSGWSTGGGPPAEPYDVDLAVLAQQPDGTLRLATAEVVDAPRTHGSGAVLVADFNEDGRDDVFLPAHNESPFAPRSSVALLSRADGTLHAVEVGDSVEDHGSSVVTIGGKPTVLAANFALSSPSSPNPIYTYDGNGGFAINSLAGFVSAMSATAADLDGDGRAEIIYSQLSQGRGQDINQWNFWYRFENGKLAGDAQRLPMPYFDDPKYADLVSDWPVKTHTPRIWTDDVNHDGRPDLLAGAMAWSGAIGVQGSVLQIYLNRGNMVFTDETDSLNPDWMRRGGEDHTLRMADIDGSGIDTYFVSGESYCAASIPADRCHANYVVVNDGSGRLHVALHDEFVNVGRAINAFVRSTYGRPYLALQDDAQLPRIIAYQADDGRINFLGVVNVTASVGDNRFSFRSALVNLPLRIDLAAQYRKPITVRDRNGSRIIRTFAGDDVIHAGSSGACTVDGGAGTDTVVYGGQRGRYTVARAANGWTVTDGTGVECADTLRNVEVLRFSDGDVPL